MARSDRWSAMADVVKAIGAVDEPYTNIVLSIVYLALAARSIQAAIRYDQSLAVVYFLIHVTVAVLFLVRRRTIERSPFYPGYVAAILATFYVYLYDFTVAAGSDLWRLGSAITMTGAVICLLSVVSLGRHFGILPSYRGVETRLMYRIVRHPIYASYLVMDAGIVLAYPSARNLALFAAAIVLLVVRIHYEELLLTHDEAYTRYAERVRYRLVPHLY
jgi:protein-S-isoprenylcysteine O-methyltransferase Ste14